MNFNVSFLEKLRWKIKCVENKILNYRLITNETHIVDTEYGKIKGVKRLTVYDDSFYSFEGIPYAKPPVGELRFKAPQRPVPWDGVKDCCHAASRSVQTDFISGNSSGSEDCLYLNVYTNNLNTDTKRPVLVFFHGGGFICGEANRNYYGADYFIKKDVVFITVQYRLGVLGFLSLNSENLNVPGNAGLKDQVMALRWIKNNCASFGGDPDCITLFGESAGAASTHYMMITEQARGLFHRAVLMSGTAMCIWAHTQCQHRGYTIAKRIGYKGENNDKDVYDFLMKANPYDLAREEHKVLTNEELRDKVMFAFGPTTEPYETPDCVLPKPNREMLKTAWGNSIPTLIGNTSYEGLLFISVGKQNPHLIKELETFECYVPGELVVEDRSSPESLEIASILKKLYVRGETPTLESFTELCSDFYFWYPMHRFLQLRFNHTVGSPIYLYRFDFDSEEIINPYRIMRYGRGVKGASHTDELTYLFWTMLSKRMPKDSREYKTIERMIGIWTQFATTGNPYSPEINGMENTTWDSLKKSDEVYKCMNIGDELKFIDLPEMEKLKVWQSVFNKKRELF
uniref:Carboxylic ester hydrolase n=1 Tax=Haematobia irritans irritans TaxID=75445 RepID=Q9U4U9_HAEIR|nr:alpha E7 esterase [Haematobia irritans irritans]